MTTRDFSGKELVKVLCNAGNFWVDRVAGDHYILKWEHPDGPEVESRTVSVPYHDSVSIGTLRDIADDAGAQDFEEFCRWIDRNR